MNFLYFILPFLVKCAKRFGTSCKGLKKVPLTPAAIATKRERAKVKKIVQKINSENPITKRFSQLCNMKNALE